MVSPVPLTWGASSVAADNGNPGKRKSLCATRTSARYARAVESGESFVITRRGRPVVRLVPIEPGKRVLTREQEAARQRARERMRRGIDMGGARFNREELYER